MTVSDLIHMGQRYLASAIEVVLFMGIAFLMGYFFVYKKKYNGKKKLDLKKLVWWPVFICYILVVLGATLGRAGLYEDIKINPFFYSYRDAWVNWNAAAWRNIILNICMMVPLGFWLPVGMKKFRCFWKTYLAGLGFTLFIELIQLIFDRGMFEFDDLMGNTVGAMIGYGLFVIVSVLYHCMKKNKTLKKTAGSILALQLPLVIVIAVFTTIFTTYANQELGNVGNEYVVKYKKSLLDVTAAEEFDTKEGSLPVYSSQTLSKEDTKQVADKFFAKLGSKIDESMNSFYDETAIYYDENKLNLWVDYAGGTYNFTDFETTFAEPPVPKVENASEEAIRKALAAYDIRIPKQAAFTVSDEGVYEFTTNMLLEDSIITDGHLSCEYYENGKFASIINYMVNCEVYKEFPVISEQEAYEKLLNGEFNYYVNGKLKIQVGKSTIEYNRDSKGFYQPIYIFKCSINGEEGSISIPALKK